jgi:hypothetical protein
MMMKSMRRGLVLVLLVSCMQSRDNPAVEVRGEDCSTCHVDDFDSTTLPPHRTEQFPTTCGDCHRTNDWQPALEGLHPLEPKFPLGVPHDNIKCFGCHDLDLATTSKAGANTNCVQCHPDSNDMRGGHAGAKSAQGVAYAYTPAVANFCFSCHPTGRLAPHPDQAFPRTGPHDSYCVTCHDRTLGSDVDGMNTTCLNSGCHSLAKADGDHREEDTADYMKARGNGSNRHFCLESGCHPDGRKE